MKKLIKPSKENFSIVNNTIDDSSLKIMSRNKIIFSVELYRLPACCVIMEVGSMYSSSAFKNSKEFEKTLDQLLEQVTTSAINSTGERVVLMANLIDNTACNLLRDSFERTKLFKNVETFTNLNSGNEVEIWLSI